MKSANVLLISDIQGDYDEIIKYGFKNVDYFKSIIIADQYFAKHPEELEKYHIILKGNQNVQHCTFDGKVELDDKIDDLKDSEHKLFQYINIYNYPNHIELDTYSYDSINHRNWRTDASSYTEFFDRIVENTLINQTLEKVVLKSQQFSKYVEYVNPNRLALPTKKSDLKILYLEAVKINKFATRIAEELKLDITCKEDNNYSLGKYIKNHLGDYDIIIVSSVYSGNLLGMNMESTEQCKDTGRELTLLVSNKDSLWSVDKDLGDSIELKYKFGGNLAPNSDLHSKTFKVLRQPIEVEAEDEYWRKSFQSDYSKMRGIIEASVNLYNEALVQKENKPISDLNLKSAEELAK